MPGSRAQGGLQGAAGDTLLHSLLHLNTQENKAAILARKLARKRKGLQALGRTAA